MRAEPSRTCALCPPCTLDGAHLDAHLLVLDPRLALFLFLSFLRCIFACGFRFAAFGRSCFGCFSLGGRSLYACRCRRRLESFLTWDGDLHCVRNHTRSATGKAYGSAANDGRRRAKVVAAARARGGAGAGVWSWRTDSVPCAPASGALRWLRLGSLGVFPDVPCRLGSLPQLPARKRASPGGYQRYRHGGEKEEVARSLITAMTHDMVCTSQASRARSS